MSGRNILIAVIVLLVIIGLGLGLGLGLQSASLKVAAGANYFVGTLSSGQYVAYVPFTYAGSKTLSKAFMNRAWFHTKAITGSTIYGRVAAISPSTGGGFLIVEFASTATSIAGLPAATTTAGLPTTPPVTIGGANVTVQYAPAAADDTVRVWFI